jgi:hypothetical protein
MQVRLEDLSAPSDTFRDGQILTIDKEGHYEEFSSKDLQKKEVTSKTSQTGYGLI